MAKRPPCFGRPRVSPAVVACGVPAQIPVERGDRGLGTDELAQSAQRGWREVYAERPKRPRPIGSVKIDQDLHIPAAGLIDCGVRGAVIGELEPVRDQLVELDLARSDQFQGDSVGAWGSETPIRARTTPLRAADAVPPLPRRPRPRPSPDGSKDLELLVLRPSAPGAAADVGPTQAPGHRRRSSSRRRVGSSRVTAGSPFSSPRRPSSVGIASS